ncbi:MAG TPA: hypothetical protein VFB78_11290 [Acidimicrobiales bacterium]|nr:hypothetical protein [Acidimicrobiales bacterium]
MAPTSDEVVRELTDQLAAVTARLEALEQTGRTKQPSTTAEAANGNGSASGNGNGKSDGPMSRRQLLTKLGAAAGVGVAGAMVLDQQPAAAIGAFQYDATNNAASETILNSTGDVNSALQVNENGAASGNRIGVDATTANGIAGLRGTKGSASGVAVGAAGVIGDSNQANGVAGATSNTNGAGVLGAAASGGRAGVQGVFDAATANTDKGGVVGSSTTGHGVAGSTTGGTRAGARGVWGTATSNSNFGAGVLGTSTTREGVVGLSDSAVGVAGVSTGNSGVTGNSPLTGVLGQTTGGAGQSGMQGINGVAATTVAEGAGVLGAAGGNASGVAGVATSGTGVSGTSTDGFAVKAESTNASAISAKGRTQLTLVPGPTIAPIAGAYAQGELFLGSKADLMLAKTGGNPAVFARVGYNALPQPFRLLDTRVSGPFFTAGERRAINGVGIGTAPNNVPAGDVAHALVINVTIVDGNQTSYLTVMPHDAPPTPPNSDPPFSTINWNPGQVLANQVNIRLAGGQFDIFNRSGNVHVILDVLGYFS